MDWWLSRFERFRGKGVAVDTELLLLWLVGSLNPELIRQFKHTKRFTPDDFSLISKIVGAFGGIITTPSVLSEASNWIDHFKASAVRVPLMSVWIRGIAQFDERYCRSAALAALDQFQILGLADTSLFEIAGEAVVVTCDAGLVARLAAAQRQHIDFRKVRPAGR
ncbi:MAG TPA: hypothetical protein PKE47_01230 [Verrucomicrobiota bacterium]|nr:hypothetical protein [Verrucomicrobiota bacterium]